MERYLIPKLRKTGNQDESSETSLSVRDSSDENEETVENVWTPSIPVCSSSSKGNNFSRKRDCEAIQPVKKVRQYSAEYLTLGFTEFRSSSETAETQPQCVICGQVLTNDSMKPSKLKKHFETKHSEFQQRNVDFFKKKEEQLKKTQKTLSHIAIPGSNTSAAMASFKVAQLIAQKGKPHTIAEELILPAAKIMVSTMIGDKAVKEISQIALSNNTVQRRIESMANNIKGQLIERVRTSPWFAIQLDETTDVTSQSVLLCCVRYKHENTILEDLLFVDFLINTTAEKTFEKLNAFFNMNKIDWTKCVGVSTDGAKAMSGGITGLRTRIREVAPSAKWHHCAIHREALVTKRIPVELKQTLDDCVKIINFIKSRALNSRLFSQLCKEMESDHYTLLMHTQVRWLSNGKALTRFWELRDEVRLFLMEEHTKSYRSEKFSPENLNNFGFLTKLAYLSDIFNHLNDLNTKLQGANINCFDVEDKIEATILKLELWEKRVTNGNVESFQNLSQFLEMSQETLPKEQARLIMLHLQNLRNTFREYFPFPDKNKAWIRDPFSIKKEDTPLKGKEEEDFIDLVTNGGLQIAFKERKLADFWAYVASELPRLGNKALQTLIPFPTTYLCEQYFSSLLQVKNKSRNRLLNLDCELRVKLSKNIQPNFEKLITEMRVHHSH